MKKYLFLVISAYMFCILSGNAQTYNMSNAGTISTCSGTFYDSGGPSGSYNNSETFQMTFCSNMLGSQISLSFTSFNSEQCCDHIKIYDGPNTSGFLMAQAEGSNPSVIVGQILTSNNGTPTQYGCLTVTWTSDGSVTNTGWVALISCTFPCQPFTVNIVNPSTPFFNGDTIHICQNTSLTLHAAGSFPNNDQNYHQADATTVYTWQFGDGSAPVSGTGMTSITHTWPVGAYYVTVTGKDLNNCTNSNLARIMILVSTTPDFYGTDITHDTICPGETINLTGHASSHPWTTVVDTMVAGMTYLPDGQGVPYETYITNTLFIPGQTMTSVSDLVSVCLNIEHSYIGDLTIWLICPSGQYLNILTYPDGFGSTYFGIPIDNDSDTSPGTGWTYCWTPQSTNPITAMYSTSLPAGDYQPTGTFTELLGCVMNGNWTIHVEDHLGSDNGYIFWWQLHFNPAIIPPQFSFNNTYDSSLFNWTGPNIISQNNGTGIATPTTFGVNNYHLEVIDDFGCSYDTLIPVLVLPSMLSVTLGTFSNVFLSDAPFPLYGGSPSGGVYSGPGVSGNMFYPTVAGIGSHPIVYSITNPNGCMSSDTSYINVFDPTGFLIANDTIFTCSGVFYDSGGTNGTYQAGENFTMTFCPDAPGNKTNLQFVYFDVPGGSQICFYDGMSATSLPINCGNNGTFNNVPFTITGVDPSGCITVFFQSSGTGNGWAAFVNCSWLCQPFTAHITDISVPYSNGDTIQICNNYPVLFSAEGTYPNNNQHYAQSDATTIFTWDFSDGLQVLSGTGLANVSHAFSSGGIYPVLLTATDINNCQNDNSVQVIAKVAYDPIFHGTRSIPDSVCYDKYVKLVGVTHVPDNALFSNIYLNPDWIGDNINSDNNGIAGAHPQVTGDNEYIFMVTDDWGCIHDTTILIFVRNSDDPLCCHTPDITAGNDTNVNYGNTITLNASLLWNYPDVNYHWEPANLIASGGNTLNPTTVTLTTTAIFTLKAYIDGESCTKMDDVIVYITGTELSATAYAADTAICEGDSTQLYALPTGGSGNYSYQWSANPDLSDTVIFNPIVKPETTTTFYVTVSDGITQAAASVTVIVYSLPVVTLDSIPDVMVNAPQFELNTGHPVGGTYTGTGVFENYFFPSVAGVGTFTIVYTFINIDGCTNSDTNTITVHNVVWNPLMAGIESKFSIYPNPFTENTLVEFSNPDNFPYSLSVSDITGKIVKYRENISDNKILIKKENLSKGLYFIELKGKKIFRGKIIVE
ncbi:MAG: T9SS type A sorting domain-containing protein [Bacteroidia bacterium]|nr:T9SS type A sorting domain-containing protein [Bacteroidia bacterium]